MTNSKKVNQIRQWQKVRYDKHIVVTADELWAKINKLWPTLSEDDKEQIFQEAEKKR